MNNCKICIFLESMPSISKNGFDFPSDWVCKKSQKVIRKNIEHFEFDSIDIPEWCQIKDTEEDLWINENIDQLNGEFEEYWSNEFVYSGSVFDINKDDVRKEFFKDKYFESIEQKLINK